MKKLVILVVCVLLGLVSMNAAAKSNQDEPPATIPITNEQSSSIRLSSQQLVKDTKEVFISPKNWDNKNWNNFLLLSGLTYLTYKNDDHIQHWSQEKRSKRTNRAANIGNAFPVAGAAYLTSTYFWGNEKQRSFAATGLESMGIAVLSTEVISAATNRNRPNGKNHSFPSTHTAAAFALATAISDEYGKEDKAIPYFAYGLATLTAFGRLNDNKHWGSDVVTGALIGHYTAKTIKKLHDSKKLQVNPYINSDQRGLVITKSF